MTQTLRRLLIGALLVSPAYVPAAPINVANDAQLGNALNAAVSGDEIILAPGTYSGGLYRAGLSGVTLRSQDANNMAVISGGNNGMQLSDPVNVVIRDLIFDGGAFNGLNIDDGGSYDTPANNITLRNVIVRNVGSGGNHDGIKLSGVENFHLDRVQVLDWNAGQGIDMVGCHYGLIENSYLRTTGSGTGIQTKGGSKNVTLRANRLELGLGRAFNIGGSTGSQYFRFVAGDSAYEADGIVVEGNVILGSVAPYAFVNIDGGIVHHNYSRLPNRWLARILNENQGNPIVDTRNGSLLYNINVFGASLSSAVNIGPEVFPETFTFTGNHWFNQDNPAQSTPSLPVAESGAIIGVDPMIDDHAVIAWTFPWGLWLVNANSGTHAYSSPLTQVFYRATRTGVGSFDPLAAEPLSGAWQTTPVSPLNVTLGPYSQMILLNSPLSGADINNDGVVDSLDLGLLMSGWGGASPSPGPDMDLDGSGAVDSGDLQRLLDAM